MDSLDDRLTDSEIESPERRELIGNILRGGALLAASSSILAAAESLFPQEAEAQRSRAGNRSVQRVEHDYPLNTSHQLPANRTRTRPSTDYIILHNTQGNFQGDLNVIKKHAKANYLVNKDGMVYSIVRPEKWANHAGRSIWEGREWLSDYSIGIEIVGYNFEPLTDRQYTSLKPLVEELQKRYGIKDREVLAHFQIAYDVNHWTNWKKGRGRRKDGINIDWVKLGINHRTDDPDVKAGRVIPDEFLEAILAREERRKGIFGIGREDPETRVTEVLGPNIIEGKRTAWTIAGDDYNQPTTFYVAPNNTITAGNQISDWGAIATGTKVYTNTDLATVIRTARPIITLAQGETVWSNVQSAFNDATTCYVLPDSKDVIKGNKANFNRIGPGTRIVLDCTGPYEIRRDRGPSRYAGREYNTDNTIYIFPNGEMKTGNQIPNFSTLPKETQI